MGSDWALEVSSGYSEPWESGGSSVGITRRCAADVRGDHTPYPQNMWPSILTLAGSIIGAAFIYRSTTAEARARQRIETTTQFLLLASVAQARRPDNADAHVGVTEQVAAISLIASFGLTMKEFNTPAIAALREVRYSYVTGGDDVHRRVTEAAEEALGRLNASVIA